MKGMQAGTRHLILKLIDEKIGTYEREIYSINISKRVGYQDLLKRKQKKVYDLLKARADFVNFDSTALPSAAVAEGEV
jgi:hypothetical protein